MGMLKAKVGVDWVPVSAGGAGGGTATDEVWIGPDDPIATVPTIELWYDSDDPSPAFDQTLRWNTAWGQIATETVARSMTDGGTVVVNTPICGVDGLTLLTGRRYRFTVQIRAVETAATGTFNTALYRNGVAVAGQLVWVQAQNNYESTTFSFYLTGDGTTANYTVVPVTLQGAALKVHLSGPAGHVILVEDIGPASGSTPMPIPPADRWNTAWGVVGVGTFVAPTNAFAASTAGPITNAIPITTQQGRRYRVNFFSRAVAGTSNGSVFLQDNAVTVSGAGDPWNINTGNYGHQYAFWLLTGDGGAHNYRVSNGGNNTGAITFYGDAGCAYYIEDIGPVSAYVASTTPFPGWVAMTYVNGWTTLDTRPAMARLVGDVVELRGCMKAGTIAWGTPAFVLPVGWRPTYSSLSFPVNCQGGVGSCDVFSDGRVSINTNTSGSMPAGGWVYIDPVRFSVTA